MTTTRYCKAYEIEQLRRFAGWAAADTADAGQEAEPDVLFLHENLMVTRGIYADEDVVFDTVTAEWEAFCRDELGFAAPDFAEEGALADRDQG